MPWIRPRSRGENRVLGHLSAPLPGNFGIDRLRFMRCAAAGAALVLPGRERRRVCWPERWGSTDQWSRLRLVQPVDQILRFLARPASPAWLCAEALSARVDFGTGPFLRIGDRPVVLLLQASVTAWRAGRVLRHLLAHLMQARSEVALQRPCPWASSSGVMMPEQARGPRRVDRRLGEEQRLGAAGSRAAARRAPPGSAGPVRSRAPPISPSPRPRVRPGVSSSSVTWLSVSCT